LQRLAQRLEYRSSTKVPSVRVLLRRGKLGIFGHHRAEQTFGSGDLFQRAQLTKTIFFTDLPAGNPQMPKRAPPSVLLYRSSTVDHPRAHAACPKSPEYPFAQGVPFTGEATDELFQSA